MSWYCPKCKNNFTEYQPMCPFCNIRGAGDFNANLLVHTTFHDADLNSIRVRLGGI